MKQLTDRQVQNISILIHFMDGLSDPRFDMSKYQHSCGTPACALGWATTLKAFNDQGLTANSLRGFGALQASRDLFGGHNDLFSDDGRRIDTPQAWAAHARKYLSDGGYEVQPLTKVEDGFRAFMQRLLAPVELTKQD